ncbi:MAG TPA: cyclic-di-AMP receptor [Firmicutes bacterium]|nr:cyclic-di-AMP receptor [Bacillota bacterium]
MKLVLAIVNKDDSSAVSTALTKEGFSVTKLATTGGFLMAGNTTFLVGVDDERVDQVLATIEKHSKKRTQMIPSTSYGTSAYASFPVEVTVGGATVFVLNIERYEKL